MRYSPQGDSTTLTLVSAPPTTATLTLAFAGPSPYTCPGVDKPPGGYTAFRNPFLSFRPLRRNLR